MDKFDEMMIERRIARDILSIIDKIYFSKEYQQYRIDYGSNGTRDLIIKIIQEKYGVK